MWWAGSSEPAHCGRSGRRLTLGLVLLQQPLRHIAREPTDPTAHIIDRLPADTHRDPHAFSTLRDRVVADVDRGFRPALRLQSLALHRDAQHTVETCDVSPRALDRLCDSS
ncbi:hypothetical protein GCM10025869_35860 [Homoserinibacter gongjuensis]|uniref:Uncharacterized protein n=1 Tax=Homoserinibacter gongjuensis TaxID=1162968 RepID=A0ABQ6JXL8_9MICO|nr:hypothetical protein GCM10025869_35860 [Homoserinibacter gongjuensis]